MALPTIEQLTDKLREHVDAKTVSDEFLADFVREAVAYITMILPNTAGGAEVVDGVLVPLAESSPIGDDLYRREVIDLAADLYWRRQVKNGVVAVNAEGGAIRISTDPWKAASARISTLQPWGFA
jgi:hypothetical protein